jgi:hypothetical protein
MFIQYGKKKLRLIYCTLSIIQGGFSVIPIFLIKNRYYSIIFYTSILLNYIISSLLVILFIHVTKEIFLPILEHTHRGKQLSPINELTIKI